MMSTSRMGRERRGAVVVLVAVSFVGLMGVMALGIDAGSLQWQRRMMQTAADAGALAGASEISRGRSDLVASAANAETARNGYTNGAASVAVTVNHAPASGFYAGDTRFVEVVVSRNVPVLFAGLLGQGTVTVRSRAVAGVAAPSSRCLVSLDRDDEKAINVSGTTTRLDVGCGVVSNSTSSKAVLIESGGTLTSGSLAVTGQVDYSGGNVYVTGTWQTAVPPSPDPLAYLQMPAFDPARCDFTNTKVDTYGVTTNLSPGIYCGGIEITSNGTAFLNPGIYILRGGGLKMGGGTITGTGVTIVNTNARAVDGGADKFARIEMGSASRATLSAATTGDLAGILFFQDPSAGKPGVIYENLIASGSSATLTGTLYFPTQSVELGASGSVTTVNGGVVAMTIEVSSGSDVNLTGIFAGTSPFKRLSLVE
jgi:Flp pilus assembly protein TadG